MSAYIIRRILFMIPTMFGIMLVAFVVVQFAPGGPVEQVIAKLTGAETGASSRISGSAGGDFGSRGMAQGASQVDAASSKYRGAQGLDRVHQEPEKQSRLRQAGLQSVCADALNYIRFDFERPFPRRQRIAADQGSCRYRCCPNLMTLLTYLIRSRSVSGRRWMTAHA
jgi:microcin C transport system permease protein